MTPKQKYYETAAATIIKNLNKRGMEGYYSPTIEDAFSKALSFISPGMSVAFGGSVTLTESGLLDRLRAMDKISLLDRAQAKSPAEVQDIYHRALSSDCYFMSTNAITMNGELVNIDGTGNRVAALIYGPEKVVILAGMNKVASDRDSAYLRVKNEAAPPNCIRLEKNTPCVVDGRCHDCLSDDCICSHIAVTRHSQFKNRIHVILIGEECGY